MNEQFLYSEAISQAKKKGFYLWHNVEKARKSLNHSVHEWYIDDVCNVLMVTHLLN